VSFFVSSPFVVSGQSEVAEFYSSLSPCWWRADGDQGFQLGSHSLQGLDTLISVAVRACLFFPVTIGGVTGIILR